MVRELLSYRVWFDFFFRLRALFLADYWLRDGDPEEPGYWPLANYATSHVCTCVQTAHTQSISQFRFPISRLSFVISRLRMNRDASRAVNIVHRIIRGRKG